jgi:hypothetical protein
MGRKVRRETRNLRISPVILKAYRTGKMIDDHLKLRKNNSFIYYESILGLKKSNYYSGTFTQNGDSLFLNFHNGHKDSSWTGTAVIDSAKKEIILVSANTYFNVNMIITKIR